MLHDLRQDTRHYAPLVLQYFKELHTLKGLYLLVFSLRSEDVVSKRKKGAHLSAFSACNLLILKSRDERIRTSGLSVPNWEQLLNSIDHLPVDNSFVRVLYFSTVL